MLRYLGGNSFKKAINIGDKYLKKNKNPIINFSIEKTDKPIEIYNEYKNLITNLPNNNFSVALKFSSVNFDRKIINDIVEICKENKTKLFIDAENSINNNKYQDLVNEIAFTNNNIFKTYQMYRRDSLDTLKNDINICKNNNILFSCKLVRGAYWNSEYKGGNLFTKKIDTDNSYNNGILAIYNSDYSNKCKVVLATHNKFSIDLGVLLNKSKYIFEFAHLQGMRETYYLSKITSGNKVHVYIPYGPYHKMIPYLSRRLYENLDMITHFR